MIFLDTQKYNSSSTDSIEALKVALGKIKQHSKGIETLIFATCNPALEQIGKIIYEAIPEATSMGVYTTTFHHGIISEDNISLFVFEENDDVITAPGIIENVSVCPVKSIAQIENSVLSIAPGKDDCLCLEFTTEGEEMLVTTLNAAFGHFNIPLIGGTTNESHRGMISAVVYNGNIYSNACIYLMIKNRRGRVKVLSENIFKNYNSRPHFATKVDIDKKALIEIDGQPAANVLSKEINVPVYDLPKYVMKYPLGRYIGDSSYIIGYHDTDSNGTLYNYKQVNLNDVLYVMEASDYRQIFKQTIGKIKRSFEDIGFIISIDCINRYNLYTAENYFNEYANLWSNSFDCHFGLVSAGEQFCRQHINQAMVCAIFENIKPTVL